MTTIDYYIAVSVMIQDRTIFLLWNANRNSHVIYRMVPFTVTLNDF